MDSPDQRYKHIGVALFTIRSFVTWSEVLLVTLLSLRLATSLPLKFAGPLGANAVTPLKFQRERLAFADFSFSRTPSGQCSAEVSLEWGNTLFVGRAIGQSSPLGDFRVASEATLRALEEFVKDAMSFELLGIKHVRAFDSNLLIVSVSLREAGQATRLVGCYLAETDTRRGAAMAVLNATNRALGNFIASK